MIKLKDFIMGCIIGESAEWPEIPARFQRFVLI